MQDSKGKFADLGEQFQVNNGFAGYCFEEIQIYQRMVEKTPKKYIRGAESVLTNTDVHCIMKINC